MKKLKKLGNIYLILFVVAACLKLFELNVKLTKKRSEDRDAQNSGSLQNSSRLKSNIKHVNELLCSYFSASKW